MPKIHDTKKQRAAQLLDRLERGPGMFQFAEDDPERVTSEKLAQFHQRYTLWFNSWIKDDLLHLVPQLKPVEKLDFVPTVQRSAD